MRLFKTAHGTSEPRQPHAEGTEGHRDEESELTTKAPGHQESDVATKRRRLDGTKIARTVHAGKMTHDLGRGKWDGERWWKLADAGGS